MMSGKYRRKSETLQQVYHQSITKHRGNRNPETVDMPKRASLLINPKFPFFLKCFLCHLFRHYSVLNARAYINLEMLNDDDSRCNITIGISTAKSTSILYDYYCRVVSFYVETTVRKRMRKSIQYIYIYIYQISCLPYT